MQKILPKTEFEARKQGKKYLAREMNKYYSLDQIRSNAHTRKFVDAVLKRDNRYKSIKKTLKTASIIKKSIALSTKLYNITKDIKDVAAAGDKIRNMNMKNFNKHVKEALEMNAKLNQLFAEVKSASNVLPPIISDVINSYGDFVHACDSVMKLTADYTVQIDRAAKDFVTNWNEANNEPCSILNANSFYKHNSNRTIDDITDRYYNSR